MLSVVVPCYNEEKNIPNLIEKFSEFLKRKNDAEVIFVNNGSTDNSYKIFEQLLAENSNYCFRVVTVPKNQGYGYGILAGLRKAQGDILAWTHADMQTDPLDLLEGWELYERNKEPMLLVKGERKNRNFIDTFFTWGMELIASILLQRKLHDVNAQPKIFSKHFFELVKDKAPFDFSLDLYFLYLASKQGKVVEFPVSFLKRVHGEAKGGGSMRGKFKLVKRTLTYILKLRNQLNK